MKSSIVWQIRRRLWVTSRRSQGAYLNSMVYSTETLVGGRCIRGKGKLVQVWLLSNGTRAVRKILNLVNGSVDSSQEASILYHEV